MMAAEHITRRAYAHGITIVGCTCGWTSQPRNTPAGVEFDEAAHMRAATAAVLPVCGDAACPIEACRKALEAQL